MFKWDTPKFYCGFNPVGDWCVCSKHRDSDILDTTNYDCILEYLVEVEKKYKKKWVENPDIESGAEDYVYTFTSGHWGVGWVEYLMVRQDAPEEIVEVAMEITDALTDYPVVDDEKYSEATWEAKCALWESLCLGDRIGYCKDAGVSIFSSRSDDIPDEVSMILMDEI